MQSRDEKVQAVAADAPLGAEIRGIDLSRPISKSNASTIQQALLDYGVIFFRGQNLSEQNQLDFTELFGEPEVHRRAQTSDSLPGIFVVSNVIENGRAIGSLGHSEIDFHSDLAYMPKPGTISTLYAVEIPEKGGATSWASGYAAYDALDASTKAEIAGKRVTHRHPTEELNPQVTTEHPVACTHPQTGRKAMFVTPYMSREILGEGLSNPDELLKKLTAHVVRQEFVYTHEWQEGDLLVWDNRCTMHRREPFDAQARRVMKRTQILSTTRPVE